MNSSLQHIDDYFNGLLSGEEKAAFEQRCLSDEEFAREVASYISLRDGITDRLAQQKKEQFAKLHDQLASENGKVRRINFGLVTYMAAASIVLFLGWFLIFQKAASQKLADQYVAANLKTLGLNMGSPDSLQAGLTAYNSKQFGQAEQIFQSIANRDAKNSEALKYLGLTHLAAKQYDKALQEFDQLSKMSLYSNPGLFFKALTLMERSKGDDVRQAKKILNNVITGNLYGSKQARDWIKRL